VGSGKEHHWCYSDGEKEMMVKKAKGKRVSVQRYKGLGEMSAEQLWETTMNPETRVMLQVTIDDAVNADKVFETLMGDEVPPRKAFIQAHAKSVKNLDI
jgi:DNA gyrase subunit B